MRTARPFQTRPPSNKAEHLAHSLLRKAGYLLCRRGYPDFITMDGDGKLAFVEVKPSRRSLLKPAQAAVMAALTEAGIPCYRYDPDDGFRLLSQEELEPARDAMKQEAAGCSQDAEEPWSLP